MLGVLKRVFEWLISLILDTDCIDEVLQCRIDYYKSRIDSNCYIDYRDRIIDIEIYYKLINLDSREIDCDIDEEIYIDEYISFIKNDILLIYKWENMK